MKYSLTRHILFALIFTPTLSAYAEEEPHRFYMGSGLSWLNMDSKGRQGRMSSINYNYIFNPSIALDIGYLDVSSDETYTSRYSTLMPNVTYKGLFGGAKVQQTFSTAIVYAKGGVSLTSYQTDLHLNNSDNSLNNYLMSPYFSLGANIPAFFEPSLDLNLELSYQDFEFDYSNTILMLGAQYRF
ncbi:outer membrane beta-barrel protein [Vibrio sp. RC27]